MPLYIVNQILQGKMKYEDVVAAFPDLKEKIDQLLREKNIPNDSNME